MACSGACGWEISKLSGWNGRWDGLDRVGDSGCKKLDPDAYVTGLVGSVGVALVLAEFLDVDYLNRSGKKIGDLFESLWLYIGP